VRRESSSGAASSSSGGRQYVGIIRRKAQDNGTFLFPTPAIGGGETDTAVSQRLLAHNGGLRGFFRLDVAELAQQSSNLISRHRHEVAIGPAQAHDRAVLVVKTSR
jgi:hypothetical protein